MELYQFSFKNPQWVLEKLSLKDQLGKVSMNGERSNDKKASGSSSMLTFYSVLPTFTNKVVAKGRCLDLAFLDREGFLIGQKLKTLSLEPF